MSFRSAFVLIDRGISFIYLFANLALTYMRLNINYTAVCNDNMTGKDRKDSVEQS